MLRPHSLIAWMLAALVVTTAACSRARFAPLSNDVTRDRQTGLEWTRRDHERSLTFEDAERYCRELSLGAPVGAWRLPELTELEGLYDQHLDAPCGDRRCRVDPTIRLRGPYVWTATSRGPNTRFYFDFGYGTSFSPSLAPTLNRRTLCVRSQVAERGPSASLLGRSLVRRG